MPIFQRPRGRLQWTANTQHMLDTQAGTDGAVPHMSQMPWRFTNEARTELLVDGVAYVKGYGYPGDPQFGETNNCLIDSLRQCLHHAGCDRKLVRRDLQEEFCRATGRSLVAYSSYLDVECHWQAILRSLFKHNTSGEPTTCDTTRYCIVALYANRPGHGVVLGNLNAAHRLVVINWNDTHFDPCLLK